MQQAHKKRSGMTLIEVLLAISILGLVLVVMLTAITRCLAVLRVSEDYHKAMWALSAAEAASPVLLHRPGAEPEDMEFGPEVYDGFTYERTVEDADVDDPGANIRLVRVVATLRWGSRSRGQIFTVPVYVVYEDE